MSDRGRPSRLKIFLELAIFGLLGLLFIAAGVFSGFSLSAPMQFVVTLHGSFMVGYGIVAPIVRKHRKQQVKEETDLIYWSFFCLLFYLAGADLMAINATFNRSICSAAIRCISFSLNTAVLGVLVMASAYLAFVIYYARLRYQQEATA